MKNDLKVLDYFYKHSHSYGEGTSWEIGGGFAIASKVKLNYHFHNPNSVGETANYIVKIFVEVNQAKINRMLQEAAEKMEAQRKENRRLLS